MAGKTQAVTGNGVVNGKPKAKRLRAFQSDEDAGHLLDEASALVAPRKQSALINYALRQSLPKMISQIKTGRLAFH
jgi:hypothetical protein